MSGRPRDHHGRDEAHADERLYHGPSNKPEKYRPCTEEQWAENMAEAKAANRAGAIERPEGWRQDPYEGWNKYKRDLHAERSELWDAVEQGAKESGDE